MLEFLSPGVSLSWDFLWQPCLFLGAGLGATFGSRSQAGAGASDSWSWRCSRHSAHRYSARRFAVRVWEFSIPARYRRQLLRDVQSLFEARSGAVRGERAPRHSLQDQIDSHVWLDPERVTQPPLASLPLPDRIANRPGRCHPGVDRPAGHLVGLLASGHAEPLASAQRPGHGPPGRVVSGRAPAGAAGDLA